MKISWQMVMLLAAVLVAGCEKKSDREPQPIEEISYTTHLIDANQSPVALSSFPAQFKQTGSKLFFTADDGVHGRELWVKDGDGVRMVADINPNGSSNVRSLIELTGSLFFTADDGVHGVEWWRSDGARTEMVKDIWPGRHGSTGSSAVVLQGWLFFLANDGVNGLEIWRTNGDATERVSNIYAPENASGMSLLAALGEWVYFGANTHGLGEYNLWRTNGVTTEEILAQDDLKPVPLGYRTEGDSVLAIGDEPYFIGSGKFFRISSDGKAHVVTTIGLSQYQIHTVAFDNKIYFNNVDGTHGEELWVWDGVAVSLVSEIAPNAASSSPYNLVVRDGWLYFNANDGVQGHVLWRTRGGAVEQVSKGKVWYASKLETIGSWVYFIARDDSNNQNLWRANGTTTEKVSDTSDNSFNYYSYPGFFTVLDGWLYFTKFDSSIPAQVLWRVNENNKPEKVAAKNSELGFSIADHYSYSPAKDGVYFIGSDQAHGTELWKLDASGAQIVSDIHSGVGTASSQPIIRNAKEYKGKLYFYADGGAQGRGLWRTGGESMELVKVSTSQRNESRYRKMAVFENWLYFAAYDDDGLAGEELWRTNGEGVVEQYADLNPGEENSGHPDDFEIVGDSLYFTAENDEFGRELWRLHAGKTERVTDIVSGSRDSDPQAFFQWEGWLYFTVFQSGGGQLWRVRGATLQMIDNLELRFDRMNQSFVVFNGHIYFVSYKPDQGGVLWRATAAESSGQIFRDTVEEKIGVVIEGSLRKVGDKLFYVVQNNSTMSLWYTDGVNHVKVDLASAASHYYYDFTVFNGWLYFIGENEQGGHGLWRTDGTNTQRVDVQNNTVLFTDPYRITSVGNKLYFQARTTAGTALWSLNGVKIEPLRVKDNDSEMGEFNGEIFDFNGRLIFVQSATNSVSLWVENQGQLVLLQKIDQDGEFYAWFDQFNVVGDRLYYVVDDKVHGREVWYYQP